MSAFAPDIPPIPRPDAATTLARFVPTALRRTPSVARLWHLPRIVILGVATAGFWPCRALQTRLRRTLVMHARQCEMAAELLETCWPADDAGPVTAAARAVDVSHRESAISTVLMLASLGSAVAWIVVRHGELHSLRQWWFGLPAAGDGLAWASIGLLCLAYLVLIVQINRQLVAMQQFALAFNAAGGDGVKPIDPPPLVWGSRPPYGLAGLPMVFIAWPWALPMTLAWAAFTEFARHAACGFRVQLAETLTEMTGAEPVVPTIDVCANTDCRQGLPGGATFCPRCGAARTA